MAATWRNRVLFTVCCAVVSPLVMLFGQTLQAQSGSRGGLGALGGAKKEPPAYVGPQFRPQGPQVLVAGVRVVGVSPAGANRAYRHIQTRKDRVFDPEVVQRDVHDLLGTGRYQKVRPYTQETPQGMIITYQLYEVATVRRVRFIGNRFITDSRLRKECGIKESDPLSRFAVEEARRRIEEYYLGKGFSKVSVSVMEGDEPEDREAVFLISEGQLERILHVSFVGNSIASDARLKTQIQAKPGILWYFGGEVDMDKIQEDVDRLTAYYRGLGYFAARIGRELEYSSSGKWLTLKYVIDEGPRYRVRSLAVNGNQKYKGDTLLGQLQLKQGEFFNLAKMNADVAMLRDIYGSQGHIFADIEADPQFLEQPGQLDLVYQIEEGKQYRVGQINVRISGEYPHTRQNVVLNRVSLRPGDIIDIREVRDSERRLKASQLFVNEPQKGLTPQIVVRPPELGGASGTLAGSSGTYRGQSPPRRR